MPVYDTQKWHRKFLDVGLPEPQARALVDLCADVSKWRMLAPDTAFDTLKHYQRLRDAKFTEAQARAVVYVALEALTGLPTPDHHLGEAA